jgi:ribonuclease BN (tRNA processing enzyme)
MQDSVGHDQQSADTHRKLIVRRAISTAATMAAIALNFAGLGFVWAAEAPADAPRLSKEASHSTRLILLGTDGGPNVSPVRSEPANLLVVNGKPYLIDAGAGVPFQLAKVGYRVGAIDRIFITHHHPDHNAGLEPLMSFQWTHQGLGDLQLPPVEIYGPPATQFLVHATVDYIGVTERIWRAGITKSHPVAPMFQAHDIDQDGLVYRDDVVRVTAAENTHFSFPSVGPGGKDRSLAYRFDTPAGSVVFTGDTGPSPAVERLAQNADVLVSEVIAIPADQANYAPKTETEKQMLFHAEHEHLSPENVGRMASAAHVKMVILTHFVPGNTIEDMSVFTEGVKKYFAGPVIAGKDLFEYDLFQPTVQGK